MSENDVSQTTVKLKIFDLVGDSYRAVFRNLGVMARISWLPIALMAMISFRFESLNDPAALQAPMDISTNVVFVGYTVVQWVVLSLAFVSLYRFMLLDEKPPQLGFMLEKRELRFVGFSLAIMAAVLLPMGAGLVLSQLLGSIGIGPGLLGTVLAFAVMIATLTGLVRLWLVLPAIALDQKGGLQWHFQSAWALAKGNTFRIFLALNVASLPLMLILAGWMYLVMPSEAEPIATGASVPAMMAFSVVDGVMTWFFNAVAVVVSAMAYRTLKLNSAEQQGKA